MLCSQANNTLLNQLPTLVYVSAVISNVKMFLALLFVRIAVSLSLGMGGGMDWNQFRSLPLPKVLSVRVLLFSRPRLPATKQLIQFGSLWYGKMLH